MRTLVLRPLTVVSCWIAILCSPHIARAQTVDSYNPGANQIVNTIALQPDGKAIVGGGFTGLGGGTGTTVRNRIGRLNTDGTVDATFNPGANSIVQAVAVQPDGKILAGGNFTAVGGGTGLTSLRSHIARFNADGTVDLTFDPGANLNVYALAVQPDGKILVGGNFSALGGGGAGVTPRIAIGRLNANGSIDTDFNPGASKLPSPGAPPEIHAIVVQPDGKILLGGYFNGLGGGTGTTTRNFIGRLNADGTVDGAFNPGASSIGGVSALAIQSDLKILVGGSFTGLGGGTGTTPRFNIGRLNTDGSVDLSFNPGVEAQVLTLGVQTDGKILAGGYFKWMGDAGGPLKSTRNYIGRMNANGTVDTGFDPGANNIVNALALQGDGAIVTGGVFDHLGNGPSLIAGAGVLRSGIGRITNTGAVQTLTLTGGGTIETWMRSGAGPEVSRATFEFSFGGSFYSFLGNGTRIAGGWQLTTGVNLPTTRKVYLRARGYYETGQNGGGSIVETALIVGHGTSGDFDGDGKADLQVFRPGTGTWYTSLTQTSTVSTTPFGAPGDVPVPGDYDGDGRSDIAVYRPAAGNASALWFINRSTSGFTAIAWGVAGDVPVPGDYDGDGQTDLAVYRPSNNVWYILQSGPGGFTTVSGGLAGDIPVPADYDGDGRTDVAVYRPSTGEWFLRRSTSPTFVSYQFGLAGDVPIPGDFDGDGKADIAIYRPSTGTWYVLSSASTYTTFVTYQWGLSGDVPVPADYDGDGRFDVAIYRPSTGTWYIRQSSTNYTTAQTVQFGLAGDVATSTSVLTYAISQTGPRPPLARLTPFNDFDGDGAADITVYRPSSGTWFTLKSGGNYGTSASVQFGIAGDVTVSGDYDGDHKADNAVFRPSTGTWYILRSSDAVVTVQQWGLSGDIPVPGDYDGDGKTDVAVYRPASGTWYILKSGDSTFVSYSWGLSGDVAVPGDYDGDGKSDVAVFRPSTGTWYILQSAANFTTFATSQWGLNSDIAVPGDFDGDGKTDVAVWRPSNGTWFISASGGGAAIITSFGLTGDVPVAGDYDGDGKVDVAVFRPSSGTWYVMKSSSSSLLTLQWGLSGDVPILKRP